ncbi:hypothetical protein KY317_02355 [Candidatus Woesearchaeota archaeon]|nr:hypothetical protein [Candidatus Woesearchaeota archaeon]
MPGKIRLCRKIIDLSRFEIRPKTTEQDLERDYDSFIEHAEETGDYFEERDAFGRALRDAAEEKRPKLIPRKPRYPILRISRTLCNLPGFSEPSKRRLHDKYFTAARCTTAIPRKTKAGESEISLDERLKEDIMEKFRQYPGYEGIIEIPDDNRPPETKYAVFHEALHYLISRYQAETGRDFAKAFVRKDIHPVERYGAEHMINESAVELLTDKLLAHDENAQFEGRWLRYSIIDGFKFKTEGLSAIATGILAGVFININLYLLPIAFVPGRIRDYALKRRKKSMREDLLKPVEYPEFKI